MLSLQPIFGAVASVCFLLQSERIWVFLQLLLPSVRRAFFDFSFPGSCSNWHQVLDFIVKKRSSFKAGVYSKYFFERLAFTSFTMSLLRSVSFWIVGSLAFFLRYGSKLTNCLTAKGLGPSSAKSIASRPASSKMFPWPFSLRNTSLDTSQFFKNKEWNNPLTIHELNFKQPVNFFW